MGRKQQQQNMRKSRFSEEQIIHTLPEAEGGKTFDRWLQRLSQGALGGGEEVGHGAVYQFQATATTF